MHPLKRRAFILAVFTLIAGRAAGQAPLPCAAKDALRTEITAIDPDGVIRIADGFRLRLANIVWPDHLEPGRRAALAGRIRAALAGQATTWKPAAGPDRWGVTPAHLFVLEPRSDRAPFWLQAGLVEAGFVPAWPDPVHSECWSALLGHERIAVRARRGYWAPRAQSARHRVIEAERAPHAGRRVAALWKIRSVRRWHSLVFVNIAPSFRGGPSLALTERQVRQLREAGQDVFQWQGKWSIARFVTGIGGMSRLRLETSGHIGLLE